MTQYDVRRVSGSPILAAFERYAWKSKTFINGIDFMGNTIAINATQDNKKIHIEAKYDGTNFSIESEPNVTSDDCGRLAFNIHFDVTKYKMVVIEDPVEMTLDEIEKKLGHKVLIVNIKNKEAAL